MKISKLHIDSHKHLENLMFDFTYQSGERKGQPLDKICFIGQSASGKTTLLDMIYSEINSFFDLRIINGNEVLSVGDFKNSNIQLEFESDSYSFKKKNGKVEINNREYSLYEGNYNGGGKDIITYDNKIFLFTAEILSRHNIKLFEQETVMLIEKYKIVREKLKENSIFRLKFDDNVQDAIWVGLLEDNINYLQKFLQFASELINKGNIFDNSSQENVNNWKSKNVNPLIDFAKKFNNLLEKINFEVDLINTRNIIPLKHKITEENIPIQNASTGTKQILLTALLLFKLDTTNSIILIDEPERSLYPDLQMEIMEHYQNLAPEAQFIVATHSPFIAASFEPEERFILSFNEEGKVVVKRGSSPLGDDPNDMLKNDFGIDYNNQFGKDAYKKYLKLKEDLVNEKNLDKKKEILLETVKLGDTYNF